MNISSKHSKEIIAFKTRRQTEWKNLMESHELLAATEQNVDGLAKRFARERQEHNKKFEQERKEMDQRHQKEWEEFNKEKGRERFDNEREM
jgi:hypothetical protein